MKHLCPGIWTNQLILNNSQVTPQLYTPLMHHLYLVLHLVSHAIRRMFHFSFYVLAHTMHFVSGVTSTAMMTFHRSVHKSTKQCQVSIIWVDFLHTRKSTILQQERHFELLTLLHHRPFIDWVSFLSRHIRCYPIHQICKLHCLSLCVYPYRSNYNRDIELAQLLLFSIFQTALVWDYPPLCAGSTDYLWPVSLRETHIPISSSAGLWYPPLISIRCQFQSLFRHFIPVLLNLTLHTLLK
jgi:hypothetical protein